MRMRMRKFWCSELARAPPAKRLVNVNRFNHSELVIELIEYILDPD
jgi:hypothetical protein